MDIPTGGFLILAFLSTCSACGHGPVALLSRRFLQEGASNQSLVVQTCPTADVTVLSVVLHTKGHSWPFKEHPSLSTVWIGEINSTEEPGADNSHGSGENNSHSYFTVVYDHLGVIEEENFTTAVSRQPQTIIALHTEKLRYSPFEYVHIRAVATSLLGIPKQVRIRKLLVLDPYGVPHKKLDRLDTDEWGVFSFSGVQVSEAVGVWTVQLITDEKIPFIVKKQFHVGDFDLPKFVLDVSVRPQPIHNQKSLLVKAAARYFFDKPLTKAEIIFQVFLNGTIVCPKHGCDSQEESNGEYRVILDRPISRGDDITVNVTAIDRITLNEMKTNVVVPKAEFFQINTSGSKATFHPGLHYIYAISVSTLDGKPASGLEVKLTLGFTGGLRKSTDAKGRLISAFETNSWDTRISVTAYIPSTGQSSSFIIRKDRSREGLVLYEISRETEFNFEAGDESIPVEFSVEDTGLTNVQLFTVGPGEAAIPERRRLTSVGVGERTAYVDLTRTMIPALTVLALGWTRDGRVVTASMELDMSFVCSEYIQLETRGGETYIDLYSSTTQSMALFSAVPRMWFSPGVHFKSGLEEYAAPLSALRELTVVQRDTSPSDEEPALIVEPTVVRRLPPREVMDHLRYSPEKFNFTEITTLFDTEVLFQDRISSEYRTVYPVPAWMKSHHSSFMLSVAVVGSEGVCALPSIPIIYNAKSERTFFVEMDLPRRTIVNETIEVGFTLFNYNHELKKIRYNLCFADNSFCSRDAGCNEWPIKKVRPPHYHGFVKLKAQRAGVFKVTLRAEDVTNGEGGTVDIIERVISVVPRTNTRVFQMTGGGELSVQERMFVIKDHKGFTTRLINPNPNFSHDLISRSKILLKGSRYYCAGPLLARAFMGRSSNPGPCSLSASEPYMLAACRVTSEYCTGHGQRCTPEEVAFLRNCTGIQDHHRKDFLGTGEVRLGSNNTTSEGPRSLTTQGVCEQLRYSSQDMLSDEICALVTFLSRRTKNGKFYELVSPDHTAFSAPSVSSDSNKSLTAHCLVSLTNAMKTHPKSGCFSKMRKLTVWASTFLAPAATTSCEAESLLVYSCLNMSPSRKRCKTKLKQLLRNKKCGLNPKHVAKSKNVLPPAPSMDTMAYTLRSLQIQKVSAGRQTKHLARCEKFSADRLRLLMCHSDDIALEPPPLALEALAQYDILSGEAGNLTYHLQGHTSNSTAVVNQTDHLLSSDDDFGGVHKVNTEDEGMMLIFTGVTLRKEDMCNGFQLQTNATYVSRQRRALFSSDQGELEVCFTSPHRSVRVQITYDSDSRVSMTNSTEGLTVEKKTHEEAASIFIMHQNSSSPRKECLTIRMNVSESKQKPWPIRITSISPEQESYCKQNYEWPLNVSTDDRLVLPEPPSSAVEFVNDSENPPGAGLLAIEDDDS